MAVRIRSRALRRAGELLKQIEPGKSGPKSELKAAADLQLARKSAAEEAGMSERQQKTAIRIANIPREDFERQIESSNPPTVTELAVQGTHGRNGTQNPSQSSVPASEERPTSLSVPLVYP
jgi:hypothetical protein